MNKEVEYLKEHLYEIYKYKKSMKDLTYDMDIEHLLRACKALDYSQKEIERLNNIINELEKYINKLNGQTKTAIAFNKGINDIYETKKYERDNYLFEIILDKLKQLKEE